MSDEGKMRARVTVKVGVGLHALLPGLQPPVMDVHSDSSLPMLEPMLSGSSLDTAWAWRKWRVDRYSSLFKVTRRLYSNYIFKTCECKCALQLFLK